MPKIDLTGKKYEFFTVIGRNTTRGGKNAWWDCKCCCGNIFTDTTTNINRGIRRSCGCKRVELVGQSHFIDLQGQIFGELYVIERDFEHPQTSKKPVTYWKCQCSCGNIISVSRTHLISRNQSSCGCKQSIGELNINKILTHNNIKYKTQYTNHNLQTAKGGYLKYDFAILNEKNEVIRLIEFDGPQHSQKSNYYFGDCKEIMERDILKNQYAKNNNIPLVRIPYTKRDTMTLEDLMGNDFLI